mmetsp:Transcript_20073/g.27665  ORF Transcript_20073/g.27665 Transcript_20073/m.27665 type:complete len:264 (+) Transcript_20073:97-888(+)
MRLLQYQKLLLVARFSLFSFGVHLFPWEVFSFFSQFFWSTLFLWLKEEELQFFLLVHQIDSQKGSKKKVEREFDDRGHHNYQEGRDQEQGKLLQTRKLGKKNQENGKTRFDPPQYQHSRTQDSSLSRLSQGLLQPLSSLFSKIREFHPEMPQGMPQNTFSHFFFWTAPKTLLLPLFGLFFSLENSPFQKGASENLRTQKTSPLYDQQTLLIALTHQNSKGIEQPFWLKEQDIEYRDLKVHTPHIPLLLSFSAFLPVWKGGSYY